MYAIIELMKRRLFIAIIPPEAALNEIEKEVKTIESRLKQPVKFEPKEKWHATLVFLGEQDESVIPKVRESLESALHGFEYKPLSTEDILFAPPHHEPRMIWLTLSENTSLFLAELRGKLVKELKKQGIVWQDEVREFHGHITLAKFPTRKAEDFGPLKWVCANRCDEYAIELLASSSDDTGTHYTSILRIARE